MQPRPGVHPDELVAGPEDEPPRSPRRRWLGAALLAVAALLLIRPDVSWPGDDQANESTDPTPRTPTPTPSPSLAGIDWPARGNLVGDRDFVHRALGHVRAQGHEVSRLYFAGRLGDGSRLVLVGTDINRGVVATAVRALYLPRGGAWAAARISNLETLVDQAQVLGWAARGVDGRVRAVVLTRPGPVAFAVSARVDFSREDGRPSREWTTPDDDDGAAVLTLGARTDPVIAVGAVGAGVFRLPVTVRVDTGESQPSVLYVQGLGADGYSGPGPTQATRALQSQAGAVADLTRATMRVLWSGTPAGERRLALVLVTRADGQRFQAMVGEQDGRGFAAGARALPASVPDELPWLLEPFSSNDPTLLVCPSGPGKVVYRGVGRDEVTLPIGPEGAAALAEPAPSPPRAYGARVTVLDPTGRVVLRTGLPAGPGWDDLLALEPPV